MRKKISIVTPTYNCAQFIEECILSIASQQDLNYEHIVVDGASTDGTIEILKKYPKVKWISEPDHGESEALNKALRIAEGDIIGWLNADDRYSEGALRAVRDFYESKSNTHMVYGKALFLDTLGNPNTWVIPTAPLNLYTLSRWWNLNLFQPTMFFSKDLLADIGFFDEALEYGVDYDYWLRAAVKGYKFNFIDQILAEARIYREGGKTETPYHVKAEEWLELSAKYQEDLSQHEKNCFWRDYYEFFIQHREDYYNGKELLIPTDPERVSGFIYALRNHGMASLQIFELLSQNFKDNPDVMGFFAEFVCKHTNPTQAKDLFKVAKQLNINSEQITTQSETQSKQDLAHQFSGKGGKVLIFYPHNFYPSTNGADNVVLSDIRALKSLGYDILLASSSLTSVEYWSLHSVHLIKDDLDVNLQLYIADSRDAEYADKNSHLGRFCSPELKSFFVSLKNYFKPDLVLIYFPYWAGLVDAPEMQDVLKIMRTQDVMTFNEQYIAEIEKYLVKDQKIDPLNVDPKILDPVSIETACLDPEEAKAYELFDLTIAINDRDAGFFERNLKSCQVGALPISFDPPRQLVNQYSGNPVFLISNYPPNLQAVVYFCQKVLPIIREVYPNFTIELYGNGSQQIVPTAGVEVKGFVKNLAGIYEQAPYAICPVILATGTQVKVLEAMSFGVPVVAHASLQGTTLIEHGVNGYFASSPEEFAKYCIDLMGNRAQCCVMGKIAQQTIMENYSIVSHCNRWSDIFSRFYSSRPENGKFDQI